MKKSKAIKRYESKSDLVQEYMLYTINQLCEQYGEVPDQFVMSLDMLGNMLTVMTDAYELISAQGLTKEDRYRGTQSSTALQTYLNAQNYAARIISSFGLTPLSKSKIKQNKEQANIQDLLASITA